ncbi:MAG: DUF1565 domain-containing protein [Bacteroidales bacterium]|nr:DUF1565 domain-containing protein [Bacteroidales bacterium]
MTDDSELVTVGHEWQFATPTILSGNLYSGDAPKYFLTWDSSSQTYTQGFLESSYHVVWFDTTADGTGIVDGFTITGGNAAGDLNSREDTQRGGGVYMQPGAILRNCIIRDNAALKRGGGVYMAGGGQMEYCLVQRNQAAGSVLDDGIGGGVAIDYTGSMKHCVVIDNAAKIGGGVATIYYPEEFKDYNPSYTSEPGVYSPIVAACMIGYNTASTEGGGLAMRGGTANHITLVRNHCAGSLISSLGHRYGRSGGLHIEEGAAVYNSVIWGNTTASNGTVQYAAYTGSTLGIKPYIAFTGVANIEGADWTGTETEGLFGLEAANSRPTSDTNIDNYYTEFCYPTDLASTGIAGAEIAYDGNDGTGDGTQWADQNWVPHSFSSLVSKGISIQDLLETGEADKMGADIIAGINGKHYSPLSTVGAFVPKTVTVTPATGIAAINAEDLSGIPASNIYTIFVDPTNPHSDQHMDSSIGDNDTNQRGDSWDNSLRFIGDALNYVAKNHLQTVQILVKEGTSIVGNRQANENLNTRSGDDDITRLRALTADIQAGNTFVYGGFASSLKDTDTSIRNPKVYPSILSGNVTGLDYDDNVAHVLTIVGREKVVIDGLYISYGNTKPRENLLDTWYPDDNNGAGIYISDARDVKLRNVAVTHCTSYNGNGAAIYVGNSKQVDFENVIVYSNESSPSSSIDPSAIYIDGESQVNINHSLVRGNVGGLIASGNSTVVVNNSAFHANGNASLRGKIIDGLDGTGILVASTLGSASISGTVASNLVDAGATTTTAWATPQLNYTKGHENYPLFSNPTTTIGVSTTGDLTLYGGMADFTPDNMSPLVNKLAAATTYDFTTTTTRNYGGRCDIGPLENDDLPAYGAVYYVRMPANGGSDSNNGNSWDTPFATITKALSTATAGKEVWVAAGTYTENITMKDGVNVLGGFIATGHPGNNIGDPKKDTNGDPVKDINVERNISHKYDAYTTTIDGGGKRNANYTYVYRGLTQSKDFTYETVYEGLKITNGYIQMTTSSADATKLGAGVYILKNAVLKNCMITKNNYVYTSTSTGNTAGGFGGGGIYMGTGSKVMNCIISYNKAQATQEFKNECGTAWMAGGGVYMGGGTLVNCLIYKNEIETNVNKLSQLGAAGYIAGESSFYNCTVAYNFGNNKSTLGDVRATVGGFWDNYKVNKETVSPFYNCIFWGNYGNGTSQENFFGVISGGTMDTNKGEPVNKKIINGLQSGYSIKTVGLLDTTWDDEDALAEQAYFFNLGGTDGTDYSNYKTYLDACIKTSPFVDPEHDDYSLKTPTGTSATNPSVSCVNKGLYEDELLALGVEEDISGAERVQDCTIDKGAYEYDGTNEITPTASTSKDDSSKNVMAFYVTETGYGTASATNPENAACWKKLQRVLDKAGEYKYNNPTTEVVVRLAEFNGYAPTREVRYDDFGQQTIDDDTENPRNYSIVVPWGVTLEGGWNDGGSGATSFTTRDFLKYPCVLNGAYTTNGQAVNAYHVVSFTNVVYDAAEGEPMIDPTTIDATTKKVLFLSDKLTINANDKTKQYARAIVDGVFIQNGYADGQTITMDSPQGSTILQQIDNYRPRNYGGAAVVTSYGHIRRCVIEDNYAQAGGGALYLKPQSLVSGTILRANSTAGRGGAIYVPETDQSSEIMALYGTPLDPEDAENVSIYGPEYPYANVFTSTVAGNSAGTNGGGIYFTNNLRMNSSVLWRNSANNNANLAGNISPSDDELRPWEYPLQMCAIENLKASGYNNFQVETLSDLGVRWATSNEDAEIIQKGSDYFPLQRYSVLCRKGMAMDDYEKLQKAVYFPTLEVADVAGVSRTEGKDKGDGYTEVGARMYNGTVRAEVSLDNYLRRLYVQMPESQDTNVVAIANKLAASGDLIYSKVGSSMVYPMNTLCEALEYIQDVRKLAAESVDDVNLKAKAEAAANARFEIYVGRGTFTPRATIDGTYSTTRGNTFLIPEGVALYGGVNEEDYSLCQDGFTQDGTALSGDYIPSSAVKAIATQLASKATPDILSERPRYDVNSNGLIEGWGLQNQTILSGNISNVDANLNAYHVVTLCAAEEYVGLLPGNPSSEDWSKSWDGSSSILTGSEVILDGLQITEGQAMNYDKTIHSTSTYYKGGGICVDGNWRSSRTDNGSDISYSDVHMEHTGLTLTTDNIADPATRQELALRKRWKGYRDIPLIIRNCLIYNNSAAMGGALYSNGTVKIYSSQFAQNTAQMYTEEADVYINDNVKASRMTYYGRGGAIDASGLLAVVNTVFANNSALADGKTTTLHDQLTPNGTGGAITLGENAALEMLNCDVVRNEADAFPGIFSFSPNKGYSDLSAKDVEANNPHQVVNTVFWGNEKTMTDNNAGGIDYYDWIFNPGFLENNNTADDVVGEALWFCAYEQGTWKDPNYPTTKVNFRKTEYVPSAIRGTLEPFAPKSISAYYNKVQNDTSGDYADEKDETRLTDADRFNFNINVNEDNRANDGPNFVNPSTTPGVSGYQPNADWMLSRINNLVDQGWTYLKQASGTDGKMAFTTDASGKYEGDGVYYEVATSSNYAAPDGVTNLQLGDEYYMLYASDGSFLRRVSLDPNPTQQQSYIDIGVYEYQHVELVPGTGELVDWLYVTQFENTNAVANATTWDCATSDVQRAIETLLSNRNNHAKEIRMLDGEYLPVYSIDGNLAFTVNTGKVDYAAVVLTDKDKDDPAYVPNGSYGVKSLTFRGGYSTRGEAIYNIEENPAVLSMGQRIGAADQQLQHIVVISDARQRESSLTSDGTGVTSTGTDRVIPIIFEGITFSNPTASAHNNLDGTPCSGGSAIYYQDQYYTDASNNKVLLKEPLDDKNNVLPKLTIKACKFSANGDASKALALQLPAVTIGSGGGSTLIFNTLFNDNQGRPLEGNGVTMVNNTMANNKAPMKVGKDTSLDNKYASYLYNSILWNPGLETGVTELADATLEACKHNAILNYEDADDANNNDKLGAENDNVITGPNFTNPAGMDYTVQPSKLIMGKADKATYVEEVLAIVDDTDTSVDERETEDFDKGYTNTQSYNTGITDTDGKSITHGQEYLAYRDLANQVRIIGGTMERGAYESQASLLRVLYVRPEQAVTGNGASWETAFNGSQMQTAIDAAAVYHSTSESASDKPETAYVFVAGESNYPLGTVRLYDGVEVYGGVQSKGQSSYAQFVNPLSLEITDEAIDEYLTYYVLPDPYRAPAWGSNSIINGVVSTEDGVTAVLDGFEMTPASATTPSQAVVITGEETAIAVRNCVIADFKAPTGKAVVEMMAPSLLYNTLVRDNTTDDNVYAVKLGDDAYAVNNTVVVGEGALAISAKNQKNNIEYAGDAVSSWDHPFAPYLQTRSGELYYDNLATDFTSKKNLWYQLSETSDKINTGTRTLGLPESLASFVDFEKDRDLLGNPRLINGGTNNTVDQGCFETWYIAKDNVLEADKVETTTPIAAGKELTIVPVKYPHLGSVVYLMGGTMLLKKDSYTSETDFFQPAYLLVGEGGSLYGQGNIVKLNYLAVEKKVGEESLMAVPYQLDFGKAGGYEPYETDRPYKAYTAYSYDSEQRANKMFVFSSDDSGLWTQMSATEVVEANQGFRVSVDGETTMRFTGFGDNLQDFIYTEDDSDKYYNLQQYDHKDAGSYGSNLFTHEHNMGWNLRGVPYLVSDYLMGDEDTYNMSAPRIVYSLATDGTYETPAQSWDGKSTLSVGEGFFTQTFTLKDSEKLTWKLPEYVAPTQTVVETKSVRLTVETEGSRAQDGVALLLDADATEMTYQAGEDGVKMWPLAADAASVAVLDRDGLALGLATAAPVDVDLPLYFDLAGKTTGLVKAWMPEEIEGVDDEVVPWLIDNESGEAVNLAEEDAEVAADGSYSLRFSAQAPGLTLGEEAITIRGVDGRVEVCGAPVGAYVAVYTLEGQLLQTAIINEEGGAWRSRALAPNAIYLVRVNRAAKKLRF